VWVPIFMLVATIFFLFTDQIDGAEAVLWMYLALELAVIEYSIDRVYEKLKKEKQ
jgi:EamA domain-containing membrane protein RarD